MPKSTDNDLIRHDVQADIDAAFETAALGVDRLRQKLGISTAGVAPRSALKGIVGYRGRPKSEWAVNREEEAG